MKLVSGGRCTGKTTKAVEWLVEQPGRVLLVPSQIMVQEVDRMFRATGNRAGTNPKVMSWEQARNGGLRGRNVEVGVDELDMMLRSIFGLPVNFATLSSFQHESLPPEHTHDWKITSFPDNEPEFLVCQFPGCPQRRRVVG